MEDHIAFSFSSVDSHVAAATSATGCIPAGKPGLVAARRDRPELLDSREEVLHQAPPLVHLPAMFPERRPVPPRRDHRLRAASVRVLEQPVRIERLVADVGPEREVIERGGHPGKFVPLDNLAVDEHALEVELLRQDVGNALENPGMHPAAEPLEDASRMPNRSGRSRHGDPVRNRDSTASMKKRLSADVPSGSDALPGRMGSIRAHMASVSTVLSAFVVLLANVPVACAAVPAVIGPRHGIEQNESQHDCRLPGVASLDRRWTGPVRLRSVMIRSTDQNLPEFESCKQMGIRSFNFTGYPHMNVRRAFRARAVPKLKTCSLPIANGRVPDAFSATPLGDGETR